MTLNLKHYQRYVAIGDSSTEGLDDPTADGSYRGWANRLAETVAQSQGSVLYANLAIRGRTTREILDEQLAPALALKPDLATVFSGTNDVIRRRFDPDRVARDVGQMQEALIRQGAVVLTFTLPNLSDVMPLARRLESRILLMNRRLREVAKATGARLVDFENFPVASDPRLWSGDRLHANSAGHARIAAALAHALELPNAEAGWSTPLPETSPPSRLSKLGDELGWIGRYLLPWLWRHANGRSSGDGITAKRPELEPMTAVVPAAERSELPGNA